MKKLSLFLRLALVTTSMSLSLSTFAGELDGKTFCRTVDTQGGFGQPKGKRDHCVSFKNDLMKDSANTFFGNPPVYQNYVLVAGKILIVDGEKLMSPYSLDDSGKHISNSAGAVLDIQ